jgi:hypothetical protein
LAICSISIFLIFGISIPKSETRQIIFLEAKY